MSEKYKKSNIKVKGAMKKVKTAQKRVSEAKNRLEEVQKEVEEVKSAVTMAKSEEDMAFEVLPNTNKGCRDIESGAFCMKARPYCQIPEDKVSPELLGQHMAARAGCLSKGPSVHSVMITRYTHHSVL